MSFIVKVAVTTLGLWVAVELVSGLRFEGDLADLIVLGLILGLVNAVARPIVTFFSLPIVLLTLGLFLLVINALMLGLTIWISEGFGLGLSSTGFAATFLGAVIISIVSWIGSAVLDD